jgi:DNA processing protein
MTNRRSLDDAERLDWLRLFRSEHVGPITFHKLIDRFGTAAEAIRHAPDLAKRAGGKKQLVIKPLADAEKEMRALEKAGGFMLAACEPDYPEQLAAVDDAPPVISVMGQRKFLGTMRRVAVVGSRNASLNGKQFAERLSRDCAAANIVVVSGLARGIDTAAHKGALAGGTIAVVAGGIDVVYPEENRSLYDAICEKGAVVAESPFGTPPTSHHFPKRNRIISGLSDGVLVVEAVQHSGSLITTRCALEQGREVMAVPGSPLDPRCKGNNNLIREGAALIENVQDIINALSNRPHTFMAEPAAADFSERNESLSDEAIALARTRIEDVLGPTPVRIDELIREVDLPVAIVLAAILELELAGKAERQQGGNICLLT